MVKSIAALLSINSKLFFGMVPQVLVMQEQCVDNMDSNP